MVLDYFSLREQPFGVTPDPRFWYASETHREALASLLYGLESRQGFVALIAKPGMGKTTVLFNLLRQMRGEMRTVFLFQKLTTAKSLLQAVLADLDVKETRGDLVQLQRRLNEVCAEQVRRGKRIVVVIDEAQNLDDSLLEFVRMLSNFETAREKLIQIVLSGQPQLAERLAAPRMIQLRQRISMLAFLKPLSEIETANYVNHRLRAAGYSSAGSFFTAAAMAMIANQSQGVPRNINNLCFNAMSLAFALKRKTIDCEVMREVISDLSLDLFKENEMEISRPRNRGSSTGIAPSSSARCRIFRPTPQETLANVNAPGSGATLAATLEPSIREVSPELSPQASSKDAAEEVKSAGRNSPGPELFASVPTKFPATRKTFRHSSVIGGAGRGVLILIVASVLLTMSWKRGSVEIARATAERVPESPRVASSSLQAATPSLIAAPVEAQPLVQPTVTIVVKPGEFLEGICADNFVRCTPGLLARIIDLNPAIRDPNHINVRQLIRIPATGEVSVAVGKADRRLIARRTIP